MAVRVVDIARVAGVSRSTAGAVLSGNARKHGIAEATCQKVLEVSRKLGYVPSGSGRALRRGRFNRIAFIRTCYAGDTKTRLFDGGGYFPTAVYELGYRGYSVIPEPFFMTMGSRELLEKPRLFSELAVDGILAVDGTGEVPEAIDEHIKEMNIPVVWLNRNPVLGIPCITNEETAGGRALARHLIDLGHQNIAYLGIQHTHYSLKERAEGIREELLGSGLSTSGMINLEKGKWLTTLDRIAGSPFDYSAFVCYNEGMYHMFVHALMRRGICIPNDLSLACFASPMDFSILEPVTHWVVPEVEMTEKGIEVLIGMIERNAPGEKTVALTGKMVVGTTTAAYPR